MQPIGTIEHVRSDEFIQSASSDQDIVLDQRQATQPNPKGTTTDEILDSLARQAKLMEEDGKGRILGLQAVLEVESDEKYFQPSNLEATRMFKPLKTRNLGRYASGAMFIGGLTFLWIYSRLSESR